MARRYSIGVSFCAWVVAAAIFTGANLRADDSPITKEQLRQLQQQNEALQAQLRHQQTLIESLTRKVTDIQEANAQRSRAADHSESDLKDAGSAAKGSGGPSFGKVNISGEGGVAFFNSGSKGIFPNAEFRVDEAKLFVEAPIWGSVYFFGELNLMTREAPDLALRLGEVYLDIENLSRLWRRDRMLNLRIGRMYVPFGEEYQSRYAIDNPLVSHSLSDLWGVDEGIELYGSLGNFTYAIALQNGGPSGVQDFNRDKSVAGRLAFEPARWLHLSLSGMRTGDLTPPGDYWSEMWFANGWFIPFGSAQTTKFHANLVEGDVQVRLPHGHVNAFGGYIRYDDNDPTASNRRDLFYYSVEAVHDFTPKLYAAARFSQIFANHGFPIAGNGATDYLFSGELTEEIWRFSLGLGYRWSQNLLVKSEYSFERGKEVGGNRRNHEDLFALEAAFRF